MKKIYTLLFLMLLSTSVFSQGLVATVTAQDILCFNNCNGELTVFATGGTAPYQYAINNIVPFGNASTFVGLCAGDYFVSVIDSQGFIVQQDITITEPVALEAVVLTLPSGIEPSGVIEITATGGTPPYAYSIDGGATFGAQSIFSDLSPGIYNVQVFDVLGCNINIETTIDSTNVDNTVEVDGNTLTTTIADAVSYQWFDAETGIIIDGATNREFTPAASGAYRVQITIETPDNTTKLTQNTKSSKKLAFLVVSSPTYQVNVLSTNDQNFIDLKVYPNPTTEYLVLPETTINKDYNIYSVLGQEINSGNLLEKKLYVNHLENGIYFLKVDGASPTRFIKQ